jgi:hypothetical protein
MNREIWILFCHRVEFFFVSGHGFAVRVKQRDAQKFSLVRGLLENRAKRRDADAAGMKTYSFRASLTVKSPSKSEISMVSPRLSALRVFLNVLLRLESNRVVSITCFSQGAEAMVNQRSEPRSSVLE